MTDYDAALSHAALFDTSSAGKLALTGPDAALFLHNLSTNDIKNLPRGGGCEAYFCNPTAKVQFQAWIYRTDPAHMEPQGQPPSLWVETTAGRNEALAKYLNRYLISEQVVIADRTSEFAQFHVAGPGAKEVLEKATGAKIDLPPMGIIGQSIRRRDLLGVPGFDLVMPNEQSAETRERLLFAGAITGSPETCETLRIEAGTPLFGPDIDESRFVMEVGYALRAVSYTKGCFLGQEPIVMARDRAGHVNRAFLGLKILNGDPVAHGTVLTRDGQEVGQVTSSCHSPRLGMPIALAYIRWKHQEKGTKLEAGKQAVEVIGLPPVQ